MMTNISHHTQADQFINDLTPGQMQKALAFYMQKSSPLEQLIEDCKTVFDVLSEEERNEQNEMLLRELEERCRFWASLV